jgi:hypothetical protein
MIRRLIRFLFPLRSMSLELRNIARELSIIRELYELELATHKPPIWRITESPGKGDTEVFYTGEEPSKKKSALEKAEELLGIRSDDDDEGDDNP